MQMPGFLASLGPAELLMAAGAALIVAIDLVFVIFGPYGFSPIAWGAAALTLILIFLNSRMMGFSAATTRGLLLTLGALAAFTWVRDVLDDVRFLGNANVAPTYYLGLLGYYVGVALLVFGAWQVWKHKA
jgi:hypothetical protein